MSVDELVDAFVSTINNRGRDPQLPEYVPAALRVPLLDEFGDEDDLCTDWRIVASDNGSRIASLERRMDKHFPPSCRNLLASRLSRKGMRVRVLQLDHEAILCNGEVSVVRRVAPSSDHLMHALIAGEA